MFSLLNNALNALPGDDFEIAPTNSASWKLLDEMEAWNRNLTVMQWRKHPEYQRHQQCEKVMTIDVLVFGYLIHRLKQILKG